MRDPTEGFLTSCWAYQKLCEDFSRRRLRNDRDALRALTGLIRPMAAGMETDLVQGIPGYYLDHFLLFVSEGGDMRRRDMFVSFSWAGWDGEKMWPRENFESPVDGRTGTCKSFRETKNILLYFKNNQIVEWKSVGRDACVEVLTYTRHGRPSKLSEVLQEHPQVFPQEGPELLRKSDKESLRMFGSSKSHGDIPEWESSSYEWGGKTHFNTGDVVEKARPLPEFSLKALDLDNLEAEFNRLRQCMTTIESQLTLHNWMACRSLRKFPAT